jgi:hypothetical protein
MTAGARGVNRRRDHVGRTLVEHRVPGAVALECQKREKQRILVMELAGLEPATSWVRLVHDSVQSGQFGLFKPQRMRQFCQVRSVR